MELEDDQDAYTEDETELQPDSPQGNNAGSGGSRPGRGGGGIPYTGRSYIPMDPKDLIRPRPPEGGGGGQSGGQINQQQKAGSRQPNRNNQQQRTKGPRPGPIEVRYGPDDYGPVEQLPPLTDDFQGTRDWKIPGKKRRLWPPGWPPLPLVGVAVAIGIGIITQLGGGDSEPRGGGGRSNNPAYHYNSTDITATYPSVQVPEGLLFFIPEGGGTYLMKEGAASEEMEMFGGNDILSRRRTPIVIGDNLYYVYNTVLVKSPLSDLSSGQTTSKSGPDIDFIFYDGKTLYALCGEQQLGYIVNPDTLELEKFSFPNIDSTMARTQVSFDPEIFVRDGKFYYLNKNGAEGDWGLWVFDPQTGENTSLIGQKDGYDTLVSFCMDQAGNFYFTGSRKGVDDWIEDEASTSRGYTTYGVYKLPADGGEAVKLFDPRENRYFMNHNNFYPQYNHYDLKVYGDYIYFLSPLVSGARDEEYGLIRMRLDGSGMQGIRRDEVMVSSGWSIAGDWLILGGGYTSVFKIKGDALVYTTNPHQRQDDGRGDVDIRWVDIPDE